MMNRIAAALLIALGLASSPAGAGTELLMLDETGCSWCEAWEREVGDAYPLTVEGRTAPLRRHSIHDPLPEGIELARRAHYTPTFILLSDGVEVGRIEGYPGEDFFYGLLGRMLEQHAERPVPVN
jgi:hypothetical protein